MTDDRQLLRQYVKEGSESAFGTLVARHIDLVYSAALRVTGGDVHTAEDVTQTVFMDLARKASGLSGNVLLAGWLYRHATFTAAKAIRTEQRRRTREQIAMEMKAIEEITEPLWEQIAVHVDESLNQLRAGDRDAIVLRFFQQQDFRAMSLALGVSEDAAQKRVSRALEKLKRLVNRRGFNLTNPALASALTSKGVVVASSKLTTVVIAASLGAALKTTPVSLTTLLKAMATTKLKAGMLGALVIASALAPLIVQQRASAKSEALDEALNQQKERVSALRAESARLAASSDLSPGVVPMSQPHFGELLRLRGEVGRLRSEVVKLAKVQAFRAEVADLPLEQVWRTRVNQLKKWLEENPSERIPELDSLPERSWMNSIYPFSVESDEECRRAMSVVRENATSRTRNSLQTALARYAKANDGQFPQEVSQLKDYFDPPMDDAILNRYTVVATKTLAPALRPGGDWAITENAPIYAAHDSRHAFGVNSIVSVNQNVTNRWTYVP